MALKKLVHGLQIRKKMMMLSDRPKKKVPVYFATLYLVLAGFVYSLYGEYFGSHHCDTPADCQICQILHASAEQPHALPPAALQAAEAAIMPLICAGVFYTLILVRSTPVSQRVKKSE